MAKKIYRILDDLSPSDMKLRDLPRKPSGLFNMHLNEYGQLVKRAGYTEYNTTSLGSGKILGMHRFYKQDTSSKEFLIAWGTSLYKLAETDPWGATALTNCPTLTAASDTYFYDIYNHCYIVNGADTMMKYNLTNVRTVGITPPSAAPTGTSPAGGSLSAGDYLVKYTYVDEDGWESNGSDASATIAASASDKITLAIVVSSDAKVTKRRIYRTIADGAIFYYDKEVANNSDTSVDLTQADSTLGQKTVLHTDHTAPISAPHLGTKRRSRAYIAKAGIVYISNLTEPEYFPLVTGQYIWTGNEQKVTGMLEQLTGLPVFTDDSIERLLGTDKDNFEFKNSYATEGCIATRSLVNCDNLLVYLEFDGIHYFDGVSTGVFSEALNKYIKDNIIDAYAYLSCATYYDNKYILCYPKTGGTYPTETIYLDLKNKTYGIYSFAFGCFSKWSRGTDGLRLFGGSNTIGRVYELDTGLDDDGSNIEAYDQTEYIDLGIPEREKNFYKIYIRCEVTTESTLTVYYQTDIDTEASVTATLTAGKDQWYEINLPSNVRGRAIKIRPRVNNKLAVTFKGYMIQYNIEELRV